MIPKGVKIPEVGLLRWAGKEKEFHGFQLRFKDLDYHCGFKSRLSVTS